MSRTGLCNLSKRFREVRKLIKNGDVDAALESLADVQDVVTRKVSGLKREIEIRGKRSVPPQLRGIETKDSTSSSSFLEYDAKLGMCTVIRGNRISDKIYSDLLEVAEELLQIESLPVNLRGKVTWNTSSNSYECVLISEGKNVSHVIRYPTSSK